MDNQGFEIDLVYLWVDGNDPEWVEKKSKFTGNVVIDKSETHNPGRYANNEELRYSLRSVEKYAPWIRHIFIVTDNQIPHWLNTKHPKIHIVDHTDIIPEEALPCFNSSVIEYFLHKISGLSEYFLFANDDMLFGAELLPDFFFTKDNFPIVRLNRKPLGKLRYRLKNIIGKELGQYRQMILDASLLVEKKFDKYYSGVPHHNIDAYRKSDYKKAVERVFAEQVKNSQTNHMRTVGDMHRSAFSYYALAIRHAHLRYVTDYESYKVDIQRDDYMKRFEKYQPQLFCMNDNQFVQEEDRKRSKRFLAGLFPVKSTFEV